MLQQRRWAQGLAQWVAKVVQWWEGQACGALAPAALGMVRCRDPSRRGQGGLYQLGWPLALLTPMGVAPPRWEGWADGLCSTPWRQAARPRAAWLLPLGEILAHTGE